MSVTPVTSTPHPLPQATYLRRLQKALHAVKQAAEAEALATPALAAKVQAEVHALQRDFDRWLRTLGDEAAAAEAAAAFHGHCARGAEEVVAFNKEHLLPKHVAAAARAAKGVFDGHFGLAPLEARFPLPPERLVAEHTAALQAAEAHVRRVVAGEPEAEALLGKDALPGLRTHAELAKTQAEARNNAKLAGVAEVERGAYEAARAGFERDFFAALQALKGEAPPGAAKAVKESDCLAAFDKALKAARRALVEGMQGELTSAGRRAELEGFLVAAAEACKREQGVLYQLDCTEQLLAQANSALAAAAAEQEALKKAFAAELAGLEEEVKRLRAGAGKEEEEGAKALGRVRELEAQVAELEGEAGAWAAERAGLEGAVAAAQQEAAAAAAAAAASAASTKKRKAEEEEEDSLKAKKGRKSAAAAEEEGEQAGSGDGMDVDAAAVKEEAVAPSPAPPTRGKKAAAAAASKGRAVAAAKGRGKTASAADAATSPGSASAEQQSKLDKAREAERKRIEESMAKRITRAGRGGAK